MVAKSPESQTTVVPVAFNCSSELGMLLVMIVSTIEETGRSGRWCVNEGADAANIWFFSIRDPVEGFLPHQAKNVHQRMTDKAGVDLLTIG